MPGPTARSTPSRKFVRLGSSPRGLQAMILAGKMRALESGRDRVTPEDVRPWPCPPWATACCLNFEGQAERIQPETIIRQILESLPAEQAS